MNNQRALQTEVLMESIQRNNVNTSRKNCNVTYQEQYVPIDDLTPNEYRFPHPACVVFKKSEVLYLIVLIVAFFTIIIATGELGSAAIAERDKAMESMFVGVLTSIVDIIAWVKRKKILVLDATGIGSCYWDEWIDWKDVGALYIKTTTDDSDEPSTKKELLLYHYSGRYHVFVLRTVDIGGLDAAVSEVVASIRFYKAASMQSIAET